MKKKDEAFLRRIFEQPDDLPLRLVYADWLEEQGDARGELIRLRGELASLGSKDPRRVALQKREKQLAGQCDQDWLMLLERADWKLRYKALEPTEAHKARWEPEQQAAIGAALREFEDKIGRKLPRAYKAYAHVFGPGEMGGFFRIYVPCVPKRLRSGYELALQYKDWKSYAQETAEGDPENAWLSNSILLAYTIGGEAVVWDTSRVTDSAANEFRICWLTRANRVDGTATSFGKFIDRVCLPVVKKRLFLPY